MENDALILIIEDDKPISHFIRISLETQGYKCIQVEQGKEGISLAISYSPDIIILDLGLPDMDGIDLIGKIKDICKAKIIIVSARDNDKSKVLALDTGADDYLTKPFSVPELLARIRVVLRNRKNDLNDGFDDFYLKIHGLVIDSSKRKVFIENKEVHLTPIEYKLMELLGRYSGRVLTHKFIIDQIWGPNNTDSQSLRVFMASLRRKIEIDTTQPIYLLTEVGVGYRLADEQ